MSRRVRALLAAGRLPGRRGLGGPRRRAAGGGALDVAELARDVARGGHRHVRDLLAPRAEDALFRAPHADRRDDRAAAIADGRADAADADPEFAAIHRVAALARLLEVVLDVAPARERERRITLHVGDGGLKRLRGHPREHRLARRHHGRRHARADVGDGLERLGAVHLVHVDDEARVEHRELDRFMDVVAEPAQARPRDRLQVHVANEERSHLPQLERGRIQRGGRILLHVAEDRQCVEQPVDVGLGEAELAGELGQAARLSRAHQRFEEV